MQRIRGYESLTILRHRNHTARDDRALRRAVAAGSMRRLGNGAYVQTAVWDSLSRDDKRRLETAAAAERNADFIASHRSAAALHGIPTIQPHDGIVHARTTLVAGIRTEHGMRKHAVADLDLHLTTVDGIVCTDLDRTLVDLAATESFAEAVVAIDWALRRERTTKDRLLTTLDEWHPSRGHRPVEAAVGFADGDSGSVGESWSRVQVDESGLPAPILQARFDDRAGLIGYVDFWWPEFGLIGEFDGFEKYRKPEMLKGRTPGEAVADEKVREDRLRATEQRPGVSRWIWTTLKTCGALADQLVAAGLPCGRRGTSR